MKIPIKFIIKASDDESKIYTYLTSDEDRHYKEVEAELTKHFQDIASKSRHRRLTKRLMYAVMGAALILAALL